MPIPDFTTYQPPGVYIEEVPTSTVQTVGLRPTVVGLIGPSLGYRSHVEAVTLEGTTAVQLAKLGINSATGFSVRATDGTLYAASEYALVVGSGEDLNVATTEDNTLTIARAADSDIPDGSIVYVTYRYTDAGYFEPQSYNDFDDIKDAYGEPFDLDTGEIISPLSFAAKFAIESGARNLVLISTEGAANLTSRVELQAAYTKLESVYDANVIVPLPVGMTGTAAAPGDILNVGVDLKAHVEKMSNQESLFRVGLVGYERTVTVDPATAAAGFRSPRVAVVHANRLNYYNGYNNTTFEVSGYYHAAAVAGILAAQPVQMPLTKKQVRGFSGYPADVMGAMTTDQKNTWSDAGVMVTETMRDGRLLIRHGTTTDRTSIQTRELSLVRAKDALIDLTAETIDRAGLIGTTIDDETPITIKGVMVGILESAVNQRVIVGYNDVKVRQQSADPSVIEIKFQYRPAYPLNYIVVSFSINALTGTVSAT